MKTPIQDKEVTSKPTRVPKALAKATTGPKMCEIPVENLKAVCDWLNRDDMTMPQNQVRQALSFLHAAKLIED